MCRFECGFVLGGLQEVGGYVDLLPFAPRKGDFSLLSTSPYPAFRVTCAKILSLLSISGGL